MKFYYVALGFNPEQPVKTDGGTRLAYYTKKHQAMNQCEKLNQRWGKFQRVKGKIYKVYCVESEPKEIE
jgi:hypothetical protein